MGSGTVFKVTPGGALTTLYSFTGGADGGYPNAALTLGTDGNFYGTTEEGGITNSTYPIWHGDGVPSDDQWHPDHAG